MKAKLAHCRNQVHQFGRADILQIEAFLDFTIISIEAAYNTIQYKYKYKYKYGVQNKVSKAACFMTWSLVNYLSAEPMLSLFHLHL